MSKIICDVCGTVYPETTTQCPICGYVHPAESAGSSGVSSNENGTRTYTYVKGGRFSKSNVKKRNRANQTTDNRAVSTSGSRRQPPKKKNNTGLVITAIILLLAIVAVVVYLALKVFWPTLPQEDPTDNIKDPVVVEPEPTDPVIKCQGLELDVAEVRLQEIGAARMIYVTVSPANTTEQVIYQSSDESVVTVTEHGKVVAVGPGEATITIICGDFQTTCDVICDIEQPSEDTTEEPSEDTTVSAEDFRLNREDITMSFAGEKWKLYSGDIDVTLITWSSSNESVAKISYGTVEAVGPGTTMVYGEINGVKVGCIIRCSFSDSEYEGVGGHGGVGEDG